MNFTKKWKALLCNKKILLLLGIVMAIKQNLSTDFTMIINEVSESNNINNNKSFYISRSNENKTAPQTSSSSSSRSGNKTTAATTTTTNSTNNNHDDMESTSTGEPTKNENLSVVSPFRKAIDSFIMVPTKESSSFFKDIKEERQKELINYWIWHDEMITHNFPGSQILTNPNAPNITIKYFDPNNNKHRGGLSDRLNDIGHQILNAIHDKHILFIKWYDAPYQLEEFLIPNLINWTLPYHDYVATPTNLRNWAKNVNNNNNITSYNNNTATTTSSSVNKHHHHHNRREIRLMPKIKDVEFKNPFGLYWYSLFRPSTRVQQQIDKSLVDMKLSPGNYDAIHMRIGHPGFRHYTKSDTGNAVDTKGGDILAMGVISHEYVLNYTNHAFSCLQLAVHDNHHHHKYNNNNNNQKKEDTNTNTTNSSTIMKPIYFFADSTELVNTMIQNASDYYYYNSNDKSATNNNVTDLMSIMPTKPKKQNDTTLEEARLEYAKKQLMEWKKHVRVVGRSSLNLHTQQDNSPSSSSTSNNNKTNNNVTTSTVVHLEYKMAPIEAHVNTFVDLYLAIQARCIAVGVGRFGYMAGKISGTNCWTLHHDFPNPYLLSVWGLKKMVKDVPNCPVEI